MKDHHDLPREELIRKADEALASFPESAKPELFFKFTCKHCGERCTFKEPNTLYERGECHACGGDTKVDKGGFMMQFQLGL